MHEPPRWQRLFLASTPLSRASRTSGSATPCLDGHHHRSQNSGAYCSSATGFCGSRILNSSYATGVSGISSLLLIYFQKWRELYLTNRHRVGDYFSRRTDASLVRKYLDATPDCKPSLSRPSRQLGQY